MTKLSNSEIEQEIILAKTEQEIILANMWEAPENYGGTLYDNHIIVATNHRHKSIVHQTNYKVAQEEMPLVCVTACFKHWQHGEVNMILMPVEKADDTDIEWAAIMIQDLAQEFVFDKDEYKTIEEKILRAFWRDLPEGERYIIMQAADLEPIACERESRLNVPLWTNTRVQEALRSYYDFTLDEEEGALITFDDDITTDSGPRQQSRLL